MLAQSRPETTQRPALLGRVGMGVRPLRPLLIFIIIIINLGF